MPAIDSHRDPAYDPFCMPSDLIRLDHHGKLIKTLVSFHRSNRA